MRLEVEWEHHDETDTQLESWRTIYKGVGLVVVLIPETMTYVWCNLLTGGPYRMGTQTELNNAMRSAIRSVDNEPTELRT